MANPWELDDEVGANPWDADEVIGNPLAKPVAEKKGYGWSDYKKDSGDYYSALGHHLANIPIAIGQTTANLAAKLPIDSFKENAKTYNQYVSQREKEYQARVPDSAASYMGATVGEVAPWLIPQTGAPKLMAAVDAGAVKLFGSGLAGRIASRSGQGLATTPFIPAVGDDYWSEKGTQAAIGAVVPNVPAALGSVVKPVADVGRYIMKPQSVADEMIARNIPANQANIERLRSAPIDGYRPTTARALAGSLSPEENAMLVAREKALRNNKEYNAAFAGRDAENNAWRLGVVKDIARADNPNALAEAEAARRQAVEPFTSQYLQPVSAQELARSRAIARQNAESLKPTEYPKSQPPTSDKFKETPDIVTTEKGARGTMVDPASVVKTLKNLSLDGNVVVSSAAKKQLAILNANMDGNGNVSAKALDDIRQNVRDTLFEVSKGSPDKRTQSAYAPVASQIVRTLDKQIPGYRSYLRTYADKSREPNTIEAGRQFLDAINSGAIDPSGNSLLTLNQSKVFNKALDKKRYGIDPKAREALRDVYQSQRQDSITNNALGIANSQTEFNKSNRLGGLLFGSVEDSSPGMLARAIGAGAGGAIGGSMAAPGTGAIAGLAAVEGISAMVNKRIMDRYAAGMLSPAEAAASLERVLEANPKSARELLIRNPAWRTLLGLPREEDKVLDAGLVTKTRAEAALDRVK